MDLSTKYLGLKLNNPIVVASSGLTKNLDQIKQCEQAGAGAVVMKSLFEEQIRSEEKGIDESMMMHPEAMEYIRAEIEMLYGPREYEKTIQEAKKSISIPIIASINCNSSKWWINYAKQLEDAGADALELNVFIMPYSLEKGSFALENIYLEILQQVVQQVEIPVALKISPYFTALGNLVEKFDQQGARGVVLFNRFIQPDVDIDKMVSVVKPAFDDPIGFNNTLRWIALLANKFDLDFAASGNIRNSDDVIKQLLVGATTVQIASVLYKEGLGTIKKILDGMNSWMTGKNFKSINDFRGKLSQKNDKNKVESFIRAQYIKTITGLE